MAPCEWVICVVGLMVWWGVAFLCVLMVLKIRTSVIDFSVEHRGTIFFTLAGLPPIFLSMTWRI